MMPVCLVVVVIVFLLCWGFVIWVGPALHQPQGAVLIVALVWTIVILYVVLVCWLHLFGRG